MPGRARIRARRPHRRRGQVPGAAPASCDRGSGLRSQNVRDCRRCARCSPRRRCRGGPNSRHSLPAQEGGRKRALGTRRRVHGELRRSGHASGSHQRLFECHGNPGRRSGRRRAQSTAARRPGRVVVPGQSASSTGRARPERSACVIGPLDAPIPRPGGGSHRRNKRCAT